MPLGQAAVVPDGATTVVCEGGAGSLLLKLKHPPSRSGNSRGNRRMGRILGSRLLVPTFDPMPPLHRSVARTGVMAIPKRSLLSIGVYQVFRRGCAKARLRFLLDLSALNGMCVGHACVMRHCQCSARLSPESLGERDQLMRHIVLTIAMLAAAPAAVAQNYPPSQTYSQPPASDTDTGASGPAMRGQSQSGSSHSGVPTAQNSQENCGTPDEFKACPPLPRHPLPYYPANRHD